MEKNNRQRQCYVCGRREIRGKRKRRNEDDLHLLNFDERKYVEHRKLKSKLAFIVTLTRDDDFRREDMYFTLEGARQSRVFDQYRGKKHAGYNDSPIVHRITRARITPLEDVYEQN